MLVDLTRKTTAEREQALAVLLEAFLVHSGLVVEALQVRLGGQLDQVLKAHLVLGQDGEVGGIATSWHLLLLMHGTGRHVNLTSKDRLHSVLLGLLKELDNPVEISMIGHGQGWHLILRRLLHDLRNSVSPVQGRVFRMNVQMDEVVGGHGASIQRSEIA